MEARFSKETSENLEDSINLFLKRALNELQTMYIDEEVTQDEMTEIIDKIDDFHSWLKSDVFYKEEVIDDSETDSEITDNEIVDDNEKEEE